MRPRQVQRRGPAIRVLSVVLAAAFVAACTDDGGGPAPATGSTSGAPPATSPTSASATPPPTAPTSTQPLVLALHPSRAPLRLTLRQARSVVRGDVRTWRPLSGEPASLRVVRGPRRRLDPDTIAVMPASRVTPALATARVAGVDPLRRPGAYPWQVSGPAPGRVRTLLVGGDVMLGRRVATANPGAPPDQVLTGLARHLRAADAAVVNLESTLSTAGPPQQGDDSFAAEPSTPAGLARLGIDAVSLANNHTGDFGTAALVETVRAFDSEEVISFGAGRNLREASRAAIIDARGLRIGLLSFNAIGETPAATPTTPGALSVAMPPRTGPLDRSDLARVLRAVDRLERRADVVVVLPHWGDQYTHVAVPAQRRVARRLAAAGAELVVGGHPHWVQGLELTHGAVVAHSLGNLVFDMDFMEQTMEGVTLTATFWDDRLMRVTLTPYRMDERFRPRLLRGEDARAVLADVWDASSGPFAR